MTDREPPTIYNKKPLTISCVMFEFPKGTTLSEVINDLQREDSVHFDDKLVSNIRIEFSTVSEEEYYERSPLQ